MNNAQASMEHIMVIAIAFVIILPLVYLFYSYSQSSAENINIARINALGRTIVNSAESIYYLGEPSKITLRESIPEGISKMNITSNFVEGINELTFTLNGGTDVSFSSNVNINGTFSEEQYSPGIKEITIESKGYYVNISIS